MKTIKTSLGVVLAALLLTAQVVAQEDEPGAGKPKTLKRSEDPVVMIASQLPGMQDAQIAKMAFMKWEGEKFSPVPFQVDEVAKNGLYVYPEGPKANPEDGDGLLNGKDELVFMARDTGGRAPAGLKVPCGAEKTVEITVSDPKHGGEGWAYLALCKGEPPRSKLDYVSHEEEEERDWVKTSRYHFSEKRGETYFDRLALQGPDGKVGENLIDRLKGRGKMTAAWGSIKIITPESEVKGSVKGWIDGPVRVIRHSQGMIKYSIIEVDVGGAAQNLFYENYFVTPIKANLPISPGTVLTTFSLRYAIDWLADFEGTRYYDPNNMEGVVIDGKMSKAENNMDYKSHRDWYALAGPKGNLVVRTVIPDQWRKAGPIELYYVDDVEALDPPESDPGQRSTGFDLVSVADVPAGKYQYYMYYMAPVEAPPGSVQSMLDIVDAPLKAEARALGRGD